jgi:nitrate/nitrite transporter NarK
MIRMTAIVSSIVPLLGALHGALGGSLSNRCATSPSVALLRRFPVVLLAVGAIAGTVGTSFAQEPLQSAATTVVLAAPTVASP